MEGNSLGFVDIAHRPVNDDFHLLSHQGCNQRLPLLRGKECLFIAIAHGRHLLFSYYSTPVPA